MTAQMVDRISVIFAECNCKPFVRWHKKNKIKLEKSDRKTKKKKSREIHVKLEQVTVVGINCVPFLQKIVFFFFGVNASVSLLLQLEVEIAQNIIVSHTHPHSHQTTYIATPAHTKHVLSDYFHYFRQVKGEEKMAKKLKMFDIATGRGTRKEIRLNGSNISFQN